MKNFTAVGLVAVGETRHTPTLLYYRTVVNSLHRHQRRQDPGASPCPSSLFGRGLTLPFTPGCESVTDRKRLCSRRRRAAQGPRARTVPRTPGSGGLVFWAGPPRRGPRGRHDGRARGVATGVGAPSPTRGNRRAPTPNPPAETGCLSGPARGGRLRRQARRRAGRTER